MLVARGVFAASPVGQVRRVGVAPASDHELERALFNGLIGVKGAKQLANEPQALRALLDIQAGLRRARLLRAWWVRMLMPVALVAGTPVVVAWLTALAAIDPALGILMVLGSGALALWFTPRRTWSGSRELRRLREQHSDLADIINAGPVHGRRVDPEVVGLGVALFGRSALLAFMPRVAADAGLLDGGRWNRGFDPADGREDPGPRRWIG